MDSIAPIDGIKIYVSSLDGLQWGDNSLLSFGEFVDKKTKKKKSNTETAISKGLIFTITESNDKQNGIYYRVRGSLHKFHNDGLHNANDFTYSDLVSAISRLRNDYSIDPYTTTVHNIESSIRLLIPLPVQKFLDNVLAHKNKVFSNMNIKGIRVGKVLKRTQYALKNYDKGGQHPEIIPLDNWLSFEVAFKKMELVKSCGIVYLSDLLDLEKLDKLGKLLLKYWNDIIYFNSDMMPYRAMTNIEQKKILYYANAKNWAKFDMDGRYKAKKRLKGLMIKYSVTDAHAEIAQLIAKKLDSFQPKKGDVLTTIFSNTNPKKRRCSDHLDNMAEHRLFGSRNMDNNTPILHPSNTVNNTPHYSNDYIIKPTSQNNKGFTNGSPNNKIIDNNSIKDNTHIYFARNSAENEHAPIVRQCKVCNVDISHKIKRAVYCGRKCNNAYHSNIRKMKRKEVRETEAQILDNLLDELANTNLSLFITYKNGSIKYTDTLEQTEVKAAPTLIRKVTKVIVHTPAQPLILTSHRAKKLIKSISQLNQ